MQSICTLIFSDSRNASEPAIRDTRLAHVIITNQRQSDRCTAHAQSALITVGANGQTDHLVIRGSRMVSREGRMDWHLTESDK